MKTCERIKIARENVGMSQTELAEKLGYKSRSSINHLETGTRDIPRSQIVKISEILGVSPAYLMGWENEESISESQQKESTPLNWNALREELMKLDEQAIDEVYSYCQYLVWKQSQKQL